MTNIRTLCPLYNKEPTLQKQCFRISSFGLPSVGGSDSNYREHQGPIGTCTPHAAEGQIIKIVSLDGADVCRVDAGWLVVLPILKNMSQWEGLYIYIPYMKWKMIFMFETTNQRYCIPMYSSILGPQDCHKVQRVLAS